MKDVSELAVWISEAIEATEIGKVNWRIIKKFIDDYCNDNNLEIQLKERELS